ncbi:MAG: 5'-nucleotidase C-terminal domain-containing protein, partial [Elusimicrobiota bacterium]|nr:5'-nucleotidase C-terminal domain-containing protein [Elusimicrobiota bacterium]
SGLRCIYNGSLPEGRRVLNIIVKDEEGQSREIDPGESYMIVTNSFLAGGGDGYSVFKEGDKVKELPLMLRELQIEYIEKNSPISSEIQGRIINVALGG